MQENINAKFHENRFISVAVPHKSSHKRGRIFVTVRDRENVMKSEIVERKILYLKCTFYFALLQQWS